MRMCRMLLSFSSLPTKRFCNCLCVDSPQSLSPLISIGPHSGRLLSAHSHHHCVVVQLDQQAGSRAQYGLQQRAHRRQLTPRT